MSEAKRIVMIVATVSTMVLIAMLFVACRAQAYTGHAGCPSYLAPYDSSTCAYHTGIRRFSVRASVKHSVWVGGFAGSCSPGPCTAFTPWLSSPWDGRPVVYNDSPYGLYLYDGEDYS